MIPWKKILITCTFLFLLFIIGDVIYLNHFISYLVLEQKPQNPQHVIDTVFDSNKSNINDNRESDTSIKNASTKENAAKPASTENHDQTPNISSNNPTIAESDNSFTLPNVEIANTIQRKIGEPIESADLLQAVSIILKKLSVDEIRFLLGFSDSKYTNEEFLEVRKLLLNKLSNEDIKVLRALTQKYGKNLEILDPDILIE